MTEKKKYLIDLLLNTSRQLATLEKRFDDTFHVFVSAFSSSEIPNIDVIKSAFVNRKEILRHITPILDEQFTVEELEKIVQFYSTAVGKKLTDPEYEKKYNTVLQSVIDDMEVAICNAAKKGDAND
tara:strand:+ start:558 stop:935 length:378 start_codon:yes stop_codon:yes gene_type:complete